MGFYGQIDKIETLLNSYGIETGFPSGIISIKDLPEKYRNVLHKFGYTDEGLFWSVNHTYNKGVNNIKFTLAMICAGDNNKQWTDLLYRNVDKNWFYYTNENDFKNDKNGGKEGLKKTIDSYYQSFQKLFMFMDIYLKQCEQMIKIVKIEYDNIQTTLE